MIWASRRPLRARPAGSKCARARGLSTGRGMGFLPLDEAGGLRVAALGQAAPERGDLPVAHLPEAPENGVPSGEGAQELVLDVLGAALRGRSRRAGEEAEH